MKSAGLFCWTLSPATELSSAVPVGTPSWVDTKPNLRVAQQQVPGFHQKGIECLKEFGTLWVHRHCITANRKTGRPLHAHAAIKEWLGHYYHHKWASLIVCLYRQWKMDSWDKLWHCCGYPMGSITNYSFNNCTTMETCTQYLNRFNEDSLSEKIPKMATFHGTWILGWAIYRYYHISWYWEPTIIVSWWFYNYRHIIFTLLVVLLHKIRHTLPEI